MGARRGIVLMGRRSTSVFSIVKTTTSYLGKPRLCILVIIHKARQSGGLMVRGCSGNMRNMPIGPEELIGRKVATTKNQKNAAEK